MLVIANGAAKSGSTWLATIVMKLVDYRPLPVGFADERFGDFQVLKGEMLQRFLDEVDYHSQNYVTKNHFFYQRDLLARYTDVYALNITRNLADALVSAFFHTKAKMIQYGADPETLGTMKDAYRRQGGEALKHLVRYHAVWNSPCSWVHVCSYERLKSDPMAEIAAIASFLRLPVSESRIAEIVEETRFETLARQYKSHPTLSTRFRRGEVGDHVQYVDDEILNDIRRIEEENRNYGSTREDQLELAAGLESHAMDVAG